MLEFRVIRLPVHSAKGKDVAAFARGAQRFEARSTRDAEAISAMWAGVSP